MKRFTNLVLSSVILFSMLISIVLPAFAEEEPKEWKSGDCRVTLYSDGTLVVSGNGDMFDYQFNSPYFESTSPWGDLRRNIVKIIVDEGVTHIGDYSFFACRVSSVTLPDSLISIGESAFFDCYNLTDLVLPKGLLSIGEDAFGWCPSLIEIDFPEKLDSIGARAFSECDLLASISFSENITSIGDCAFECCYSLDNVFLPESLTNLGEGVFSGCESLTNITLLENINTIAPYMFESCISLTNIELPDGITTIGDYAFNDCRNLISINYPEGITSIGDYAFKECTSLPSISLPKSLISIGVGAFKNCKSMKEIILPKHVTSIGETAFEGCISLTDIVFSESLRSIGASAFYNCSSLLSIILPEGLEGTGKYAFENCTSLVSITLPESLLTIDEGSFEGCTSLTSITIPENVTVIGNGSFAGCTLLENVIFPSALERIDDYAFISCKSLEEIILPKDVVSIGLGAFELCESLTSIVLSEGLVSIEDGAFDYCYSLTNITLPEGLIELDDSFDGCNSLISIFIPKSLTTIVRYTFRGCYSLSDVYYAGSEEEWNQMNIDERDNECLLNANIHFNSTVSGNQNNKIISGILQEGDGWALKWKCTYHENDGGVRSNPELTVYMDGTDNTCSGPIYMTDLTGEKTSPWLTETGFKKSDFVKLKVRGTSNNSLHIIDGTFKDYTGLKEVALINVSSIDSSAFENCSALKKVDGFDGSLKAISQAAFKNCIQLDISELFDNASSLMIIGKEAFMNVFWSDDLVMPNSLQKIGEKAFYNSYLYEITLNNNVKEIGTDAFAGNPYAKIRCYENSYAHQYAVANGIPYELIDYELTDFRYDIPSVTSETDMHHFIFNTNEEVEDLVFSTNSVTYNPRLSHFLAVLSRASYDKSLIDSNLKELGFSNRMQADYEADNLTSAYSIGRKNLDNGSQLVLVVIRGSIGMNWLNNFNLGADSLFTATGWHAGISQSAENIYNNLKIFMGGSLPTDNITYVITGHSLGGGAGNLLSVLLSNAGVPASNVYDYNFAAPNVAMGPDDSSYWNKNGCHSNIINIGNWCDQVIHLPNALCETLSIGNVLTPLDGYNKWKKYGVSYQFNNGFHLFVQAHDMETYLDYLEKEFVSDSFVSVENEFKYKAVSGRCPVDIVINDINGKPIASVIDNEPNYYGSEIGDKAIIIINGDKKLFYINSDEQFIVNILATDEGEMDYSTADVELVSGTVEYQKDFEAVDLLIGKEFTSVSGGSIKPSETKLFVLGEDFTPALEIAVDGTETVHTHEWDDGRVVPSVDWSTDWVMKITCDGCYTARFEDASSVRLVENSNLGVDEEYITGIAPNTSPIKLFDNFVAKSCSLKLFDPNDTELAEAFAGTGQKLKVLDDDLCVLDSKTLVVSGDTSGDGLIDVVDVKLALNASLGKQELSGAFGLAADVNSDLIIDVVDVKLILNVSLGKVSVF